MAKQDIPEIDAISSSNRKDPLERWQDYLASLDPKTIPPLITFEHFQGLVWKGFSEEGDIANANMTKQLKEHSQIANRAKQLYKRAVLQKAPF